MEVKKFWTIKNGLVGTAHINRDKNVVDFRKGKIITFDYRCLFPNLVFMSQDGEASRIVCKILDIEICPNFVNGRAFLQSCRIEIDGIKSNIIDMHGKSYEVPKSELSELEKIAIEIRLGRKGEDARDYCAQQTRNRVINFWEQKDQLSKVEQGWVKKFIRTDGRKCLREVADLIPQGIKQHYKEDKESILKIARMIWAE